MSEQDENKYHIIYVESFQSNHVINLTQLAVNT